MSDWTAKLTPTEREICFADLAGVARQYHGHPKCQEYVETQRQAWMRLALQRREGLTK